MRRPLLLLAALALTGSVLAGCGDEEVSAVSLISTASATTAEAGSTTIQYQAEVEGLPAGAAIDSFELVGDGAFDFEDERGRLDFTYPEDLPQVGGSTFESVFEGTTTYLRSEVFGPLPDGAEWIRMDVQELLSEEAGVDLSQVTGAGGGSSDPTASLELLDGASEDGIEELGDEQIDGVDTTHYRAEIDLSEFYEDLDAVEDEAQFEGFLEQFGDNDTVTTDVWLDDDGRVVRQRYEQPFPIDGADSEATMTVTMTFQEFGEPVDVEIPDEGDTIDIQELIGAAGDL